MRNLILVALVGQTTAVVLLMRYSRTVARPEAAGPRYCTTVAVFLSEAIKLSMCLAVCAIDSSKALTELLREEVLGHTDTLKYAVPALAYTIQNNLLLVGLSHLSAPAFQVTYQSKTVFTAVFSWLVLQRELVPSQWMAVLLLSLATVLVSDINLASVLTSLLNRFCVISSSGQQAGGEHHVGILAVLGAAVLSGASAVYLEGLLKKPAAGSLALPAAGDLALRNIQLALFAIPLAATTMWLSDRQSIAQHGMLQGFGVVEWAMVLINSAGGLLVAAVMKYADSIVKCFASALAIIFGALISVPLFGFSASPTFICGTSTAVVASVLYAWAPTTLRPAFLLGNYELRAPCAEKSSTLCPWGRFLGIFTWLRTSHGACCLTLFFTAILLTPMKVVIARQCHEESNMAQEVQQCPRGQYLLGTSCQTEASLHAGAIGGIRIIGGSATSTQAPHYHRFITRLLSLCEAYPIDLVVNHYNTKVPTTPKACMRFVTIPGHKGLFWRIIFTPKHVRIYSHVWLFDDDVHVGPQVFDLMSFLAIMRAHNAMVAQPRITSTSNSRTSDHKHLLRLKDTCKARCTNLVEVMTPMFTRKAWDIVHEGLLSQFPTLERSVWGVDELWCSYLRKVLGVGATCVTINMSIAHENARSIDTAKLAFRGYTSSSMAFINGVMRRQQLQFVKPKCASSTHGCMMVNGSCTNIQDRDSRCSFVTLLREKSTKKCIQNKTFGCREASYSIWTSGGCRGYFQCGNSSFPVKTECGDTSKPQVCHCMRYPSPIRRCYTQFE